jgi:diacylglycerol kinase (ATP)
VTRPFRLADRVRSFRDAFAGVRVLLKSQHNVWIHAVASVAVVTAAGLLGISRLEWCVVLLAMALVWVAEGLNTALELLADAVSPEHHPLVGQAKDVAAAAVLLAALGAATVGVLVLGPRLLIFLGGAGS